jgi:hypothetical protein
LEKESQIRYSSFDRRQGILYDIEVIDDVDCVKCVDIDQSGRGAKSDNTHALACDGRRGCRKRKADCEE